MSLEQWTAVDEYLTELLVRPDKALISVQENNRAHDLPAIDVSPVQGKFLHLLAMIQGARSILEIGTLGGYSTIWFARALPPDGRLITIEIDPQRADVAARNIQRAGLDGRVDIRIGRALDVLPRIDEEGLAPFDMIFIDADKPSNPDYFAWALKFSRKGTVIVIDNVIRDGAVIDADSEDAAVQAVRRLNEMIAAEPRVEATAIQMVGSKGYDGFAVVLVTSQ